MIFLGVPHNERLQKSYMWQQLLTAEYLQSITINNIIYIGKQLPEPLSYEELENYEKNILSLLNKLDQSYKFNSKDLKLFPY